VDGFIMPMSVFSPAVPSLTRRSVLVAAIAGLSRPAFASPSGSDESLALHVLNRLAFGPSPGDLDRVMRMGTGAWIAEQMAPGNLAVPDTLARQLNALASPKESQRELIQHYREATQAAKELAAASSVPAPAANGKPQTAERGERRALVQSIYLEAGEARLLRAVGSPRQLEEVLVDFWFNHFNVFEGKGLDRVLVENYEREAIRPHVFGRFRAMLGATAKHPAMLFYLDNWLSVAPGFQPRRPGGRPLSGLNENYAREVMELHTLGVDGGYTQQDVTELARILTGWTMMPNAGRRRLAVAGDGDSLFAFEPERHDPGSKNWLGHSVAPTGQAEGEFALDVLARHPATARHIAMKLVRHFVADDPPPGLLDRVARRFSDTDGDLRSVMHVLVESAEFRDPRPTKFKTPYQFVVSGVRSTGIPITNVRPLLATLRDLGQPLFGCQTPDGYKDTQGDWLNPSAITQRVNFATALASGRLPLVRADDSDSGLARGVNAMDRQTDRAVQGDAPVAGSTPPVDVGALLATLGSSISTRTRATVDASGPALRAALVLGSPDFMQR
jgi:uncharacterized protein (DUF1800 family)